MVSSRVKNGHRGGSCENGLLTRSVFIVNNANLYVGSERSSETGFLGKQLGCCRRTGSASRIPLANSEAGGFDTRGDWSPKAFIECQAVRFGRRAARSTGGVQRGPDSTDFSVRGQLYWREFWHS